MSTIKASNIQNGSSASVNIALNTDGSATFAQMPVPSSSFLRNRIINGDQRINQRNTTITVNGLYCTDRWFTSMITSGAFSFAQSTNAPSGFTNSLLFTKTTGGTPAATEASYIVQFIEGLNISDFGWGTAAARTVTLSFWVNAGATGTFGGSLRNAGTYSYPFSYSIPVANTWTYITITVPGPTTGTWATDNSIGVSVFFDIGSGANFRAAAGSWAAGNYVGATGTTTYPVSTSGGTLAITGVQLEVGSVATPFERRNYQTELSMCSRYYELSASIVYQVAASPAYLQAYWAVQKRTAPTLTVLAYDNGTGATFLNSSMEPTKSFFQNGNHSASVAQARVAGSAEL